MIIESAHCGYWWIDGSSGEASATDARVSSCSRPALASGSPMEERMRIFAFRSRRILNGFKLVHGIICRGRCRGRRVEVDTYIVET